MPQQGREVVIVEAVRTPIGRGHPEKGYYKDLHPADLLGRTYVELLKRAGVDPSEVEDVLAGCAQQFGEQGQNIARNAWLQEGLPIEAAATTMDRQCGSAQQAINFGALQIAAGIHDVVIGSGVEHMGHISFADGVDVMRAPRLAVHGGVLRAPPGQEPGHRRRADRRAVGDPALGARRARAALAPEAHRATEEGWFEREIVPIRVNGDVVRPRPGHPPRDDA